jgi:predicted nuclease of restriction endonuclease-like RecB superfamily
VDSTDDALQQFAERLLLVYRAPATPTRGEVEEMAEALLGSHPDPLLARGLNKLLLDRCEFAVAEGQDYPAWRAAVFRVSGEALRQGVPADLGQYRDAVLAGSGMPAEVAAQGLYADLPENDRLTRFRDLTPRQVLERYNVGLVQALLLRAAALDVVVDSPDAAKMRRLLKYLRFFRLLARLSREPGGAPEAAAALRLHIDGPASLFAEAKRYGLQLACFFPAICGLDVWRLDAVVEWKGQPRPLRLTQDCGLVSHYRNFSAYVPEEIRMFHEHFGRTVAEWRITGQTPFLHGRGQEMVFPDLSFTRADGTVLHVELFHRWHAGPLRERLLLVQECPDLPLIMGVDVALARDPEVEAALAGSGWFQERGFTFRDYPTVSKTLACLERAAVRSGRGDRQ